jgi:phenylpyruvate tautomerase PptA (4-oxalocrotonate tautomerase family)
MPLWQIYHPPSVFTTDEEKAALAADITAIYTGIGLPAFYVIIHFNALEASTVYVGGQSQQGAETPFIRIVITHIAVRLPDNTDVYNTTTAKIDAALKPHVYDKGYKSEYHVGETERRLWKIDGLIPPEFKSEQEEVWRKEGRAVPYEGAYWSAEKERY